MQDYSKTYIINLDDYLSIEDQKQINKLLHKYQYFKECIEEFDLYLEPIEDEDGLWPTNIMSPREYQSNALPSSVTERIVINRSMRAYGYNNIMRWYVSIIDQGITEASNTYGKPWKRRACEEELREILIYGFQSKKTKVFGKWPLKKHYTNLARIKIYELYKKNKDSQ